MEDDSKYILKCPVRGVENPRIDLDIYRYVTLDWDEHADNIAMIDSTTDQEVTYTQLRAIIDDVAGKMTSFGVRQSDMISIWGSNYIEVLYTAMAAWKLGACVAMIGSSLTSEEARRQLLKVDTAFVLADSRVSSKVADAVQGLNYKSGFRVGNNFEFGSVSAGAKRLHLRRPASQGVVIQPDDSAIILFSSGTTGHPKAVEIMHKNIVLSMEVSSSRRTGASMPPHILFLPITHFYGLYSALRAFVDGSLSILMARFDVEEYLRLIAKHQIPVLFLVPAVAVMLTKNPELVQKYDLSSVFAFYSSAAPLAPEVANKLHSLMPQTTILPQDVRVSQTYGLTETSGAITRHPLPIDMYEPKCPPNSIGIVAPCMEVKIVDVETGRACPPKVNGEIVARGDTIMKGYYGDPEATRAMIDKDGWLHTGDIGYYEETGYIFIVDRAKELIKVKGMQVAPAELEEVLLAHDDIQDAAVVGLPDELSGELPAAFVVARANSGLTEAQVVAYIAGKVAPYKQLKGGVRFIASIPRVASGKILRRVLRDSLIKSKL